MVYRLLRPIMFLSYTGNVNILRFVVLQELHYDARGSLKIATLLTTRPTSYV